MSYYMRLHMNCSITSTDKNMRCSWLKATQITYRKLTEFHQWLFQISMKLPSAKIELGPIYDRLMHTFSFSGLKMRLAGL